MHFCLIPSHKVPIMKMKASVPIQKSCLITRKIVASVSFGLAKVSERVENMYMLIKAEALSTYTNLYTFENINNCRRGGKEDCITCVGHFKVSLAAEITFCLFLKKEPGLEEYLESSLYQEMYTFP